MKILFGSEIFNIYNIYITLGFRDQTTKSSSSPEDFLNTWLTEPGTLDRIRKDSRSIIVFF